MHMSQRAAFFSVLIFSTALVFLLFFKTSYEEDTKIDNLTHKTVQIDKDALEKKLSNLSEERLQKMLASGEEIVEWYRVLNKINANIVSELLKYQGRFYEWDHYPRGDVIDPETFSQYFYHSHRGQEHGHFHVFFQKVGIPDNFEPVFAKPDPIDERFTHIIAISMDKYGFPVKLFTTNRWVTDEDWYQAEDISKLLDIFQIDHPFPSWPSNQWLNAMISLFHPQIIELLHARDEKINQWQKQYPDFDIFEDRNIEVLSEVFISVETQIDILQKILNEKAKEKELHEPHRAP